MYDYYGRVFSLSLTITLLRSEIVLRRNLKNMAVHFGRIVSKRAREIEFHDHPRSDLPKRVVIAHPDFSPTLGLPRPPMAIMKYSRECIKPACRSPTSCSELSLSIAGSSLLSLVVLFGGA